MNEVSHKSFESLANSLRDFFAVGVFRDPRFNSFWVPQEPMSRMWAALNNRLLIEVGR